MSRVDRRDYDLLNTISNELISSGPCSYLVFPPIQFDLGDERKGEILALIIQGGIAHALVNVDEQMFVPVPLENFLAS